MERDKGLVELDMNGPTPMVYIVETSDQMGSWKNAKIFGLFACQTRAKKVAERMERVRSDWERGPRYFRATVARGIDAIRED